MFGAAAGGFSPGDCGTKKSVSPECWAGVSQICRAGREARLTWRNTGTHLPPRVPSPLVAGRWQRQCGQHLGCWRQQAPWQLKAQRVGLGQSSLSPGAHVPFTSAQECAATSSLRLAGGREGAFCSFSPGPLFFCPPSLGNPWPGSCENQGRETTFLALKGGGSPSRLRLL